MQSLWDKQGTFTTFQTLNRDISTEAVVIGGGLCGILTAYFLQKQGIETVVLEANTVGSGQTHLTTAKITWQHGPIYQELLLGNRPTHAHLYAEAGMQAIEDYEELIRELSIPCHFERLPSYLYSKSPSGRQTLEREHLAYKQLSIHSSLYSKGEYTALCLSGQAQFHPLHFLDAVARNLTVYEHTKVLKVHQHEVFTDKHTVRADYIIFACHYPFLIVPGFYFLKMHQERSYAVALSCSTLQDKLPPGMFYGLDADTPSIRTFKDTVILGGGGHRTGKGPTGCPYETLKKLAGQYFPESPVTAKWSAQDCITLDRLPLIGQYSVFRPYWYVATGFGKWGMTTSMTAARLLTNLICKRPTPYAALYAPGRALNRTAVRNLFTELGSNTASLLTPGKRCTHMGCCLEYNPVENTYDCPCHGSRFDTAGTLLDGPARKNRHP